MRVYKNPAFLSFHMIPLGPLELPTALPFSLFWTYLFHFRASIAITVVKRITIMSSIIRDGHICGNYLNASEKLKSLAMCHIKSL